jgi:glycosyltransferase involved in cell wall biosynthesis
MKTILIITDNLRNQINGVVTTFTNLGRIAALDNYNLVYIDPSNFTHVSAPGYSEVKLSLPFRIGAKIKATKPDFIHIATEGPIGLAAKLWLDKRGWKYNTSYHTKFPEFLNKIYKIPERLSYSYLRWFHKHSGVVLTTTQTMVDELRQHGFSGNIIPWTRGVDSSIFYPETDPTLNYILCVSRVSKEKNLDAFCEIKTNLDKVIVGDGPYLAELEKKYPDVIYTGKLTGKSLRNAYADAKCFVFPSKADTFGIVMIEAMACGVPVAAYPVPGPVDVIEQYETGAMDNELSVAIERCLDLDRTNVYEKSKKWSWENCWEIFKNNLVPVD